MTYTVVLKCSLCRYNPNEIQWTGKFHIVFRNREDGVIILIPQTYIPYPYRSFGVINCTFGTPSALQEIRIRFQLCRLKMQSRGAHLIHSVCLETLQNLLGQHISAEKLFMICRSLEQEWGKEELVDLKLCHPSFDPTKPLINIPDSNNLLHNTTTTSKFETSLPVDVRWMVLSYLDSKSLLSYFSCSREASESAIRFPTWQLLYRYFKIAKVQNFIVCTYDKFEDTDYLALDSLLLWLEDLNHLAHNVKVIPSSDTLSFKIPASLSPTDDFPLGHRRIFAKISTDVKGLTVYIISIRGRDYISGIEGIPSNSCQPIGHLHGPRQRIFFNMEKTDNLSFLIDSLGLRSLQIGESTWSSGTPDRLGCFEGRSILKNGSVAELVVFTDALKFRHIGWHRRHFIDSIEPLPHHSWESSTHISETIIMRPQRLELVSSQDIVYIKRNYCDWALQTFLTITTESIIFDDDMSGISIIYRNERISGIRVHSQGTSKFIGQLGDREEFFPIGGDKEESFPIGGDREESFPIGGNKEAINRIDVFLPWCFAIKIYTTFGREHAFGQINQDDECHTFSSSEDRSIHGLILAFYGFQLSLVAVSYQ
ncbi:hypothetical protein EAF04_008584 [Stromatinia cepivora]|nr:hypothetical protein EAF04_008584 [Stromatinia cepivora]